MARYIQNDLTGALAPVNPELEKIKQAILDTLSRKGDTPNAMEADLDMNGQRILNLLDAVNDAEPATYGQVKRLIERLLGLDFEGTQLSPEEIQSIIDGVTQEILDSEFLAELNQEIEALELEDLNLRTDINGIVNDLNAEIARVDGIFGDLDDIDTAILNETNARISGDEAVVTSVTGLAAQYDNLSAQLLVEQQTRATADSAIVQTIQTLQTFSAKIFVQPTAPTIGVAPDNAVEGDLWYDSDDNNHPYTLLLVNSALVWTSIRDGNFSVLQSQIQTEQTARIDGDGALATQITNLTSVVASDKAFVLSAIQDEATTRSTADSALATTITNLTSTVNTNNTDTLAALSQEATTRANADTAISNTVNTLAATVTTNNTNAFAAIQSEATTRATADSALASNITTLTSTVNNNTASIQTVQSTVNGIAAEYSVKLDVNGYVTGYGQYNEGPGASGFIVLADKFAIVTPGINPVVPFVVTAEGVFIKEAFIESLNAGKINGQLVRGQLQDNIINGVKIENGAITADKIFANSVTADKILAGSVTADKLTADAIYNKRQVITSGTVSVVTDPGTVELTSDLVMWVGPSSATTAASRTKQNGIFWIASNGSKSREIERRVATVPTSYSRGPAIEWQTVATLPHETLGGLCEISFRSSGWSGSVTSGFNPSQVTLRFRVIDGDDNVIATSNLILDRTETGATDELSTNPNQPLPNIDFIVNNIGKTKYVNQNYRLQILYDHGGPITSVSLTTAFSSLFKSVEVPA